MPSGQGPSVADQRAAWNLVLPAFTRVRARIEFLESSSRNSEPAKQHRAFNETVKLEELLSELLSFILPREYPRFDLINSHVNREFAGFPGEVRNGMIAEMSKGWRGRRVVRRHRAAAALAWHDEDRQRNWRQAAERFCACDRNKHTSDCAARLKRDASRLKALLRDIQKNIPEFTSPPVHK